MKAITRGYNVHQYDRNGGRKNLARDMVWKGNQSVQLKSKNAEDLLELAGKIQEAGFLMNGLSYTLSPEVAAKLSRQPTIDEVLYKYDAAKMTYSYRITDVLVEVLPVTNYSSHLTVKPRAEGGSTVEWRGAFYRGYPNNDPPPELNDEAAIAAVDAVYQAGLDALVTRFGAP